MRIGITINHEHDSVMFSVSVVQYRNLHKRLFAKNNDDQDRYLKNSQHPHPNINRCIYYLLWTIKKIDTLYFSAQI